MLPRCPPFPRSVGESDVAGWPPKPFRSAEVLPIQGLRPAPVNSLYGLCPRIDAATAAELVEAVRSFVQRDVVPAAAALDHADIYPDQLVDQLAAFGLFGALIPEQYGGLGLDVMHLSRRIVEELAAGWMSLTGVLNTHMIAATLLRLHGSDEQRRRLLPRMASGAQRAALSLSEADAGVTPAPSAAGPTGTATST